MATEWRHVRARYWPKWLIGRLTRPKKSDGLVLVPDSNIKHKQRQAVWVRVSGYILKEAATESGAADGDSLLVLLVLGYDGKVGKRQSGPRTAKVKVVIGDRVWWIVDVKTEQFEYLFVSGLPDDSEIHEQEETA